MGWLHRYGASTLGFNTNVTCNTTFSAVCLWRDISRFADYQVIRMGDIAQIIVAS